MGKQRKKFEILILVILFSTIVVTLTYLVTRIVLYIKAEHYWYENFFAMLLLLAETFIIIHGFGYLAEVVQVVMKYKSFVDKRPEDIKLENYPYVAVVVPSYKEPIDLLRNTLICTFNLKYKNKEIFLLDDTRYDQFKNDEEKQNLLDYKLQVENLCKEIGINLFRRKWRGAKAGIINDFLDFIKNRKKEGTNCIFNKEVDVSLLKYLCVFDADQNPMIDFLDHLMPLMETNDKLAFIQTPQYYTNFEENRVARAAGLQQVIFYEYICIGKSEKNAMFCCGTNVVFRIDALLDVGGFDETSVTEDFATSIKFHLNGWKSMYYSRVLAFGLGPEDLGNYFKQQYRWALGTIGVFKTVLFKLLTSPSKMKLKMWWEYLLSTTHYFIGAFYFVLIIMPIIYLFFRIPIYFASPIIYGIVFLPYIIITLVSFFWTLRQRHYTTKDIFLGQFLMMITFPVYIKAAFHALINKKSKFEVTSKDVSAHSLPIKDLWVQFTMIILLFSSIIWGLNRVYFERILIIPILVNAFWCAYNVFILSKIFYFNNPIEKKKDNELPKEAE
ncbi:MAG: Cellulose synthase catalytic subunit [UDP-forming] [Candidatus Anoxychlamydiales bacterium]|nr:Cellulose synthase catalytic subunit [UDP-forming] [Candidatus Anoxychlamydiales bacterium]